MLGTGMLNGKSGRISGIRPALDIRYPAFILSGYKAKSISGASLKFAAPEMDIYGKT
jgi:hypothetical protein